MGESLFWIWRGGDRMMAEKKMTLKSWEIYFKWQKQIRSLLNETEEREKNNTDSDVLMWLKSEMKKLERGNLTYEDKERFDNA